MGAGVILPVSISMKTSHLRLLLAASACACGLRLQGMDASLGQFLYAKQQQIRDFSETITNPVPHIVWRFYDSTGRDDWAATSNLFNQIRAASQRYSQATNDSAITPGLATRLWPPLSESYGACEQFHEWNQRWLHRYGREIIDSIPRGSIYFGGTDPGRFVISALSESQVEGKPFFTLTQNQLADGTYVQYLQAMYGKKIAVPNEADLRTAFQEYIADAGRRLKAGQLKPGEDVRMVDGVPQISGQVAVMEINALLVRQIFNSNSNREFYVEESFPLDWMYPHLTPHGLIMQLNRQPRAQITEAETRQDQEYWEKLTGEILGHWLKEPTTVKEVCDFVVKYGPGRPAGDYPGDKDFAANDEAGKSYSKLRRSLAGMYAWRVEHAQAPEERQRMQAAADYAFRQSFALCPQSPEAIFRYVNFLAAQHRIDDAILLVKTALRLGPADPQLRGLLQQLEKYS